MIFKCCARLSCFFPLKVQPALRFSSFVDLGLLSQAFLSCGITLTNEASSLYLQRLAVVGKEELANLAQPGSSDLVNSSAAALERVAEGSLKMLTGVDGEQLLAALRPLTLELCARRAIRPRTAAGLLALHAHFRRQDGELFEALSADEPSHDVGATLAGRLLRPLGSLGYPSQYFLVSVDKALSSPSSTWQKSLPALAADFFAASLLDFAFLSESSVTRLCVAAKTQCQQSVPTDTALRMKCAGELAAASYSWLQHVPDLASSTFPIAVCIWDRPHPEAVARSRITRKPAGLRIGQKRRVGNQPLTRGSITWMVRMMEDGSRK